MKVNKSVRISGDHTIEWGDSTWDNGADFSIRNRYDNTSTGGFNVRGSSEIPWHDFNRMINESLANGQFSTSEIADILNAIARNSLK
ncbi:MAG TPA: hypothetical protein VGB50_01865 [Flavobacterium sp.]|jgi:hypothetical protein